MADTKETTLAKRPKPTEKTLKTFSQLVQGLIALLLIIWLIDTIKGWVAGSASATDAKPAFEKRLIKVGREWTGDLFLDLDGCRVKTFERVGFIQTALDMGDGTMYVGNVPPTGSSLRTNTAPYYRGRSHSLHARLAPGQSIEEGILELQIWRPRE